MLSDPGEKLKHESVQCPMWKCYVKKDVTDHLLVTFVPASFDDLLLLNPSHADVSPEEGSDGLASFSVSISIFVTGVHKILNNKHERVKLPSVKKRWVRDSL